MTSIRNNAALRQVQALYATGMRFRPAEELLLERYYPGDEDPSRYE